MPYCLNPDCQKPENPPGNKFCQTCGAKLLLREHYRAIALIGQGGFGRTFLAIDEDKPSKPRCVIKQFYPQSQGTNSAQKAAELFAREAVRLDELGQHSQIPELLANFEQDNRLYIVQEFIDGQNLADELTKTEAFHENDIRNILNDLLPVLETIHAKQVIHRDIKPENIIRRRSDGKLVLVDFGAAKYATATALAQTGTTIGSAGYAAPEQSFGKAIFASDLYSLGVTCIHLLTQIQPFDLYDAMENRFVWRHYLVNNPVSDELANILDTMTRSSVKDRYQSASEAIAALSELPRLKSVVQKDGATTSKFSQWRHRIEAFSTQVSTKVSEAIALDWTRFHLHYEDYVELYAPATIVADYVAGHSSWFGRCAHPMKVSPLSDNAYDLLLGRYGAFKFELEVRIGLELVPSETFGVYSIRSIPLQNYSPPGYEVDFQGTFDLREMPVNPSSWAAVFSEGAKPPIPSAMTRWEWQLDLNVGVQFPQFIRAMPPSLIRNTGDRLLMRIVREISRRLAIRVQADFHKTFNLPFPQSEKR